MDICEKLEILRHKLAGMISAAVEPCDEGECCESCKYSHSTACTDYLIADYMIANGVTIGRDIDAPTKWIPVSERLPQEDGSYLVTTNYFGKHQGINIRCFAKDGETVNEYDLAGQKYVWYFYDNEYGYVSTDSVTHWMPLPQPPKGE